MQADWAHRLVKGDGTSGRGQDELSQFSQMQKAGKSCPGPLGSAQVADGPSQSEIKQLGHITGYMEGSAQGPSQCRIHCGQ
jgi:hypothetical protein